MKANDANFELLAKEIVIKGVDDYKRALKQKWALENKLYSINNVLVECEQFFCSEWCKALSDIDDSSYIKNNAFIQARKEFKEDEIVSVSIKIKPKKKTEKKTE